MGARCGSGVLALSVALVLAGHNAAAAPADFAPEALQEVATPWQPVADLACAALTPWQALLRAPEAERLAWVGRLGQELSAQQSALLATLAWDTRLAVRMAAQDAAQSRCARAQALACSDFTRAFAEARNAPGRWRARVALLHSEGVLPHPDTLIEPPLTLVSRLGGLLRRPLAAASARAALQALMQDPDPEVQEAASAALMGEGE